LKAISLPSSSELGAVVFHRAPADAEDCGYVFDSSRVRSMAIGKSTTPTLPASSAFCW
jgi:hypothetical protein